MSPRAYAVKKVGIHTSAHQPHALSRLQTILYSCSAERISVRGADTKTEQVGSSEIVSVEERWGRYTDWSSISHQDLHQNRCERIEVKWREDTYPTAIIRLIGIHDSIRNNFRPFLLHFPLHIFNTSSYASFITFTIHESEYHSRGSVGSSRKRA